MSGADKLGNNRIQASIFSDLLFGVVADIQGPVSGGLIGSYNHKFELSFSSLITLWGWCGEIDAYIRWIACMDMLIVRGLFHGLSLPDLLRLWERYSRFLGT
jgi:hypothetical protein